MNALFERQLAEGRRKWSNFLSAALQFVATLTVLFKSWGLQSLNFLIYDQKKPEGPKYVIRKSFWIGIGRCTVHVLPAAFCIFITYISMLGIFIGDGFSIGDQKDRLFLICYQIAAKLLELLSITSMGAILLQVLRQDLMYGDGVPLGLLTSHLWCTKPQSVLSPEYISAAQTITTDCYGTLNQLIRGHWSGFEVIWKHLRRIRLFLLISFAVLIASLIGPFSAVLLIPREQYFPAGGTSFNLNATDLELWPGIVTSELEHSSCSFDNASLYPICPSGGFYVHRNKWSLSTIYDATNFRPSLGSVLGSGQWMSYTSTDPWGVVPEMNGMGNDRNSPFLGYMPTAFAQANVYTAVMFQTLLRDWCSAARDAKTSEEGKTINLQSARSFIHAPLLGQIVSRFSITSVRCSSPQNLSVSADSFGFHRFNLRARFVDNNEITWGQENDTIAVNISSLQRHPTSHLRTQWIDIPTDSSGFASTGLLFEMPWSATNTSRIAVGCTVAAAWCTAALSYTIYTVEPDFTACISVPAKTLSDDEDQVWQSYVRLIALDRSWLDLLTPKAPTTSTMQGDWQPSTLDVILEAAGFGTLLQDLRQYPQYIWKDDGCDVGRLDRNLTDLELWDGRICFQADKVAFIERTLARLVTDGLSRRLSYRAFDMLPSIRSWIVTGLPRTKNYNKNLVDIKRHENAIEMSADPTRLTQTLDVYVSGYGYAASSVTDYVAIGVVCAYVVVSMLHVAWNMWKRVSSSSWESPLELMLLAWNSPQAAALKATSAQIHRWKTYQHVAKVRATDVAGLGTPGTVEAHLKLILEEPTGVGGTGPPHVVGNVPGQQASANLQCKQIEVDKKYY